MAEYTTAFFRLSAAPPLIRLPRLTAEDTLVADLVLKLEFFNPLGSVSNRIGLDVVEAAELAGDNPANPDIHQATTAREIWTDTDGRVDMVVAGVGTGGTLTGIGRALRPRRPALLMVGVEAAESAVLSGDEPGSHAIQGIGPGFQPSVLDLDELDQVITVSERDAIAAARRCARLEGQPIGISSVGMLHVALGLARVPENEGELILGIVPSFAERHPSTALFSGLG